MYMTFLLNVINHNKGQSYRRYTNWKRYTFSMSNDAAWKFTENHRFFWYRTVLFLAMISIVQSDTDHLAREKINTKGFRLVTKSNAHF